MLLPKKLLYWWERWWRSCRIQLFFLVSHSWITKQTRQEWLAFPGVQHTTSHPSCRPSLALWMWKQVWWQGSRKAPLRLCLHCCPLVNDRAVGSWSSVYAVIKHSKPRGWQQAHSLAPGHSAENKTHLMLCFPAPWDPTPEESRSMKSALFLLKVHLYWYSLPGKKSCICSYTVVYVSNYI